MLPTLVAPTKLSAKKAVVPVAKDIHSFILLEYLSVVFQIAWVHRFEVTSDMSSVACSEGCWGVIPVVIARS